MEEASVEEEHPTGARKLRSPARVDKALESASRIGAHYESAVSGVAQVEEDTNGGFEVRRARVGHETSELRGGVGDVDARHVCEPEEGADNGHVPHGTGTFRRTRRSWERAGRRLRARGLLPLASRSDESASAQSRTRIW